MGCNTKLFSFCIIDKANHEVLVGELPPGQQGRSKDGLFSSFNWSELESSWEMPSLKLPSIPSLSEFFDYEYDYTYDSAEIQKKFNFIEKMIDRLKGHIKKKAAGEKISGNEKGLTNSGIDQTPSSNGNNQSLTNTDKTFKLSDTNAITDPRNNTPMLEDSNQRFNILMRILENYFSCEDNLRFSEHQKPLSIEIKIDNFSLVVPGTRNFSETVTAAKKVENFDRELEGKANLTLNINNEIKDNATVINNFPDCKGNLARLPSRENQKATTLVSGRIAELFNDNIPFDRENLTACHNHSDVQYSAGSENNSNKILAKNESLPKVTFSGNLPPVVVSGDEIRVGNFDAVDFRSIIEIFTHIQNFGYLDNEIKEFLKS